MPIPIPDPEAYTVPPSEGFTPDRLGVRRVIIDVDRSTNVLRANLTPCPATETAWGPTDYPDFSSADVGAEIAALPDGPDKLTAAQAMQAIAGGLVALYSVLSAARTAPPEDE